MAKKNYLLTVLCGLPLLAHAIIYVTVLPDGTKLFSDTPQKNSVVYTSLNTHVNEMSTESLVGNTPVAAALPSATTTLHTTSTPATTYAQFEISAPPDQTTVHNQSPISVSLAVDPPLQNGDKVQLMVDGKPYKTPQADLIFSLDDLIRGPHQIQGRIVTANGIPSQVTLPITLYKQQSSSALDPGK